MSYQVIARKYRPQRFAEVVGQDHVTQTLGNAIRSGRIAHAYLFCGPRGTGKTTIARIFAKALNCTDGPRPDFDEQDPRCLEITEGRSLDVLEIDGASNNGVEQVRELRDTARFAPASSRFKIYIIDEVHMLTPAAFNALLKTLEEPPAHVKFLFATTDPEKVLPTILSRCQRFDLRRIPNALIVQHLTQIAQAEGVSLADAALQAIARGADGGMRDAESTLDQLISFCGERIEEADVLSMFGLTARDQILALTGAILDGDARTVIQELDGLARNGKDLGRLLNDLLQHFRNLLVFEVAGGDLALLEVSEAEAAVLSEQSKLAPVESVTRVLETLSAAEGRFRDASARRIFLEVTLLKAIQARQAVNLDVVLRTLQAWRDESPTAPGVATPTPRPPSPTSATSTLPRPASAAVPTPAPTPVPTPPAVPLPSAATTPLPRTEIPTSTATAKASPTTIPIPTPTPSPSPNPSPTAPLPPPPPPSVASAEPAVATVPSSSGDPKEAWNQLVAGAKPMTRPVLQAAQWVSLEKSVLTLGFPPGLEKQRSLLESDRTRKAIEARMAELGHPVKIRWITLEDATPASVPTTTTSAAPLTVPRPATPVPATAPEAPSRPPEKVKPIKTDLAEFKNDPLIREALELFKGQLTEVAPNDSQAG